MGIVKLVSTSSLPHGFQSPGRGYELIPIVVTAT